MLNKESIHQFILNPNAISSEESPHLKSLLKEHPYAHTLSLLYLKGLKNTKDLAYEKQLPKTSILSPNRKVLYQLIIQDDLIETIEKEIEEIPNKEKVNTKELAIKIEPLEKIKEESKSEINELEQNILAEVASYSIEKLTPKEPEIKKEPISTSLKSQSFTSWLNTGKKVDEKSIIDDFIHKNPSITRNQTDFYSATNVAKMSVIEEEGFVTETLARVYMKQGHFDKAIKTYRKLSLKIPEKKAFFASQIEVIEELKKQE